MGKSFQVSFGTFYYDKFSIPLCEKKDIINLILDTLNALELGDYVEDVKGNLIVKVDKMSRVFYCLDDKFFSIKFPFFIEEREEGGYTVIDNASEYEISNRLISLMRNIMTKFDSRVRTLEELLEQLYYDPADEGYSENDINICWGILMKMLMMEVGYIRYDYDELHENGDFHPLKHLDINYSSNCTYKLGLKSELKQAEFVDLLDTQTKCRYVV